MRACVYHCRYNDIFWYTQSNLGSNKVTTSGKKSFVTIGNFEPPFSLYKMADEDTSEPVPIVVIISIN